MLLSCTVMKFTSSIIVALNGFIRMRIFLYLPNTMLRKIWIKRNELIKYQFAIIVEVMLMAASFITKLSIIDYVRLCECARQAPNESSKSLRG